MAITQGAECNCAGAPHNANHCTTQINAQLHAFILPRSIVCLQSALLHRNHARLCRVFAHPVFLSVEGRGRGEVRGAPWADSEPGPGPLRCRQGHQHWAAAQRGADNRRRPSDPPPRQTPPWLRPGPLPSMANVVSHKLVLLGDTSVGCVHTRDASPCMRTASAAVRTFTRRTAGRARPPHLRSPHPAPRTLRAARAASSSGSAGESSTTTRSRRLAVSCCRSATARPLVCSCARP